jgi:peroxiredoxin
MGQIRRAALLLALLGTVAVSGVAHADPSGEGRGSHGAAWFGVSMDRTADGAVHVRHVLRGSPAEAAGVKDGDRLIAIDNETLTGPGDVTRIVSGHAPGDALVVRVARGDGAASLRVALVARPSSDEMLRMDRVGAFAPPWTALEPVGDAPASLGALRGKVVLLDFWATWCRPCRALAPRLSALQARYGAQGLQVLGVTTDSAEAAAVFAQRTAMRYPVAIDRKGETSRAYEVSALPTLFVIDKRGVVRDIAVGYDEDAEAHVETLLRELLAEPAPKE